MIQDSNIFILVTKSCVITPSYGWSFFFGAPMHMVRVFFSFRLQHNNGRDRVKSAEEPTVFCHIILHEWFKKI